MLKKLCCFLIVLSFGFINVSAAQKTLVVCGDTVLINGQYNGVLVSGHFDFEIDDTLIQTHPIDSVQITDLIVSADGKNIKTCSDLNQVISSVYPDKKYIDVTVKSNNELTQKKLYLYFDPETQTFKTGFYIKDHISGIGTLTYYDPVSKMYGALGHEIVEKSTKEVANIEQGQILAGNVTQIKASTINSPGEKTAKNTGLVLGNILYHNRYGIFGISYAPIQGEVMEIATRHQVQPGHATIRTVLSGNVVKEYDILITKVHQQTSNDIKGLEIQIIDENLLQHTGGIVQGMSGSPIIQDGKLVGAVTHVLVNDPTRGYGIFIENMLEAAG